MKIKAKKMLYIFFWCIWFIIFIYFIYQLGNQYLNQTKFNRKDQLDLFFQTDFFQGPVSVRNFERRQYIDKEWSLRIPKINLKTDIKEGTEKEVLKGSIGHFKETNVWYGNVGLAAHNRNGGKAGFFKDIKNLNKGDLIEYKKDGKVRKYFVIHNKIIPETDWTMLENTKENRITLITCEEGKYEYRRCIQAIEKGENENEK